MNTHQDSSFTTRPSAFKGGMVDAFGAPAVVLGACYLGFGSLIRDSDFGLWFGLISTISAWALPGQVAMVELYSVGASVVVISLAVLLTNARLMPMVMTLIPLFRNPGTPRWQYYVTAHFIAVTGWLAAMRRCPSLPGPMRMPYFSGFAVFLWGVSLAGTAAGFLLAAVVPEPVSLGFVFLNPIYFMLALMTDFTHRTRVLAIGFGVVLGPVLHSLTPDWGLLATGVIAGTMGYFAGRRTEARHG